MKICGKCKIEYPLEDFHYRNKATGTRASWCKECMRLWYIEHQEEQSQRNLNWWHKNNARKKFIDSYILPIEDKLPSVDKRTKVRFWEKVDIRGEDDCWEWQASRGVKGYGFFRTEYSNSAHRVSYLFAYGEIPDGLQINHHCDNPPCVNPKHIYAGTAKDNTADMLKRSRHRLK